MGEQQGPGRDYTSQHAAPPAQSSHWFGHGGRLGFAASWQLPWPRAGQHCGSWVAREVLTGFGSEWDTATTMSLAEETAPAFTLPTAAASIIFCQVPADFRGAHRSTFLWTVERLGCVGTAAPSCHPCHRAVVLGELGLWIKVWPTSGAGLGLFQLCYSPCFCSLHESFLSHC